MDFDVLIIGAGISGIDAAYHLRRAHPGRSFAILEAQDDIGGTWRTHRFPGIRSDSDLFTFGFGWKPWTGVPIATADQILAYLNAALDENDLRRHIRFGSRVLHAAWDSGQARWRLDIAGPDGSADHLTCRFLWMCSGYYRHDRGHVPDWPGKDEFPGAMVHPQAWPDDLDHAGKRVVVIGSGATAATLVPALAGTAAHVTMLQRSPTYFYAKPMKDDFADTLRALDLPPEWFHEIMRRKILREAEIIARRSFEEPDALAEDLIAGVRAFLGPAFDVDTHFRPAYRPWRQRLAMIPDGDLFMAIREGRASVVTDRIAGFTPDGIELESGAMLEADIVVTATGFDMDLTGGFALEVDGEHVDLSDTITHLGIMFTGLPNLAFVFGYLRSSWTMRADMVSDYVCRLLSHMESTGAQVVVPKLRDAERDMPLRPWIEPENFNAGYVTRNLARLPRQGTHAPWVMTQDYYSDRETLPAARFDDGTLRFS